MSKRSAPRRRTVEIYFILYLASLLFLLPDGKNKDKISGLGDRFISELPFNIYPEKTNLSARIQSDSAGVKLLFLDSCNNIFYSGEVRNVKYEFTIYDAMMKQSMTLRSESNAKYYRVVENPKNNSVAFYWKPTQNDYKSKSYIVQVLATAEPMNGAQNILYQAKTQFSLNILSTDRSGNTNAATNTIVPGMPNMPDYQALLDSIRRAESMRYAQSTGDYDLSPEKEFIQQLAYQKWVNAVFVYNIDLFKDLKNKPQIIVSGDANQKYRDVYSEIYRDKIVLSGSTPPAGRVTVKIVLDRKADSKQKSISFTVKPLPMESAQYDKTMYANKTYLIDPKLPLLDKETRAELRFGNQLVMRSVQGTKFNFTPSREYIGKYLELERYIDNVLIPEENRILIADYPMPEIISIQQVRNGKIEVKTKSYGSIDAERNLIANLEISGDVQFRELFGRYEEGRDGFSHIQTFEISSKSSNPQVKFTIVAVDKSGKKSRSRTYSGE